MLNDNYRILLQVYNSVFTNLQIPYRFFYITILKSMKFEQQIIQQLTLCLSKNILACQMNAFLPCVKKNTLLNQTLTFRILKPES